MKTISNLSYIRNNVIYGDRVKYCLDVNNDDCFNSIPIDSSYKYPRYSGFFYIIKEIKIEKIFFRNLLDTYDLIYH